MTNNATLGSLQHLWYLTLFCYSVPDIFKKVSIRLLTGDKKKKTVSRDLVLPCLYQALI